VAPHIILFASPDPAITLRIENARTGGAAINQLAQSAGAELDIHVLAQPGPEGASAALSETACCAAVQAGWAAVHPRADLIALGVIGPDAHAQALTEAVGQNGGQAGLETLAALGGQTCAALAGAIAGARAARIPVLLDGVAATLAGAILAGEAPGALDHCLAAHSGAEPDHATLLDGLGLAPVLSLGVSLDEGAGAALAMQILQSAVDCHRRMATAVEAGLVAG
jgi:nicotinate-nucleotide--dimethylbenzimidazole phosphoribosyltransferase